MIISEKRTERYIVGIFPTYRKCDFLLMMSITTMTKVVYLAAKKIFANISERKHPHK